MPIYYAIGPALITEDEYLENFQLGTFTRIQRKIVSLT